MLIKITNQCGARCSHCMENSTPNNGEHMTRETFDRALDFTGYIEADAWRMGAPPFVLLSGGECSEHPEFLAFIEAVEARQWIPLLITNGSWLTDTTLRDTVLRPGRQIIVQVTNDARFYPQRITKHEDSRITYVDHLSLLMPLGRAGKRKDLANLGLPIRKAPSSFNLRSVTRTLNNFAAAVCWQRLRASSGLSGHCSPSISYEGFVMAGETNSCFKLGTVASSNKELTLAVLEMRCNKCGLVDNLSPAHKRAIGESSLFGVDE